MKQNKLALYLSNYTVREQEIEILNRFGIADINPINVKEKGAMRIVFSHDPENVIIIYGSNSEPAILRVLRNEGYETVEFDRIRGLLESTEQICKMFEGEDEKTEEDQFI